MQGQKLAVGLGWFSLGVDLYELLAPGHLSCVLGLEAREELLRREDRLFLRGHRYQDATRKL